ncbi:Uncharacterized protein family Ycf2, partial [Cynara cardunculus var. scolymus]
IPGPNLIQWDLSFTFSSTKNVRNVLSNIQYDSTRSSFVQIITYLQNIVSIHTISSYLGCDMVPKDESDMDISNKISFLKKNPFFDLFHLFHDQNRGGYTLHHILDQKKDFKKWQIYSLYQ